MTTYYVANAGSDSNSGLTTGTAWATVAHVNAQTFSAGDSILFNRGDTWSVTALIPPSSGSSGTPITFGAYGTGAQPIFSKTNTQLIQIGALHDLTFQDLNLYQTGSQAPIAGSGAWTGAMIFQRLTCNSASDYVCLQTNAVANATFDQITVTACGGNGGWRFSGAGNGAFVFTNITGLGGTGYGGIYITNGTTLTVANYTWVGGIYGLQLTSFTGAMILANLTISSTTAHGVFLTSCSGLLTASGITTSGTAGIGFFLTGCALGAGSTLASSTFSSCANDGLRFTTSSTLACTDCVFQNATGTGSGVQATGTWSAISFVNCQALGNVGGGWYMNGTGNTFSCVNCLAQNNGGDGFSVGDETNTIHDVIWQNCTAVGNGLTTNNSSGDGFTAHLGCYNIAISFCLAYNNTQSGVAMIETSEGTIYDCVFYNNGNLIYPSIRGNIYIGTTGSNPTTGTGWTIKNCISVSGIPCEIKILSTSTFAFTTFDYNQYYHPADSNFATLDNDATYISWTTYHTTDSYEAHSQYGDPLFVNPSAGNFHLGAGSPAIKAGTFIAGVNTYNPPDIGIYEGDGQGGHRMGSFWWWDP